MAQAISEAQQHYESTGKQRKLESSVVHPDPGVLGLSGSRIILPEQDSRFMPFKKFQV
jgi:hypothetical protein